jgi:hypothetical protein
VLVDGIERETALGHLDEGHGPGRVGGVALEPLVDGLVRDAQVGVVGQPGDDAGHAEIGHPAAELGLPAVGVALEPAEFKRLAAEHRHSRGETWALLKAQSVLLLVIYPVGD